MDSAIRSRLSGKFRACHRSRNRQRSLSRQPRSTSHVNAWGSHGRRAVNCADHRVLGVGIIQLEGYVSGTGLVCHRSINRPAPIRRVSAQHWTRNDWYWPRLSAVFALFNKQSFYRLSDLRYGTYAAILAYLSTVPFFMRDVFDLPTEYFGYAFALSVAGFMVGALLCSRLVMRLGTDNTLTIGVILSLLASATQWWAAPEGTANVAILAASSFSLFFGIGLTSANAAMGAVSLFPHTAGAASAVFGFVHATIAAAAGFIAGKFYDGTLVPTATIMLICALAGVVGIPLARGILKRTDSD